MVPGIDMMRLFSMRILNGKNPFKGDRNHMHHILSKKYGYLKSLIIINSIIIILILSSFFFKVSTLIIIPMYLLLYFLIIYEKKNNK
jgi:UDP-GlcNAc:undecaprenyl-phosphate GlcNAc-1-phosphate transferase